MQRLILAPAALIPILLAFSSVWAQGASTQAVRQARTIAIQKQQIRYILFSPDGSLLATNSSDGIVRVFDVSKGELQATITRFEGDYLRGWSPDGKQLVIGNYNTNAIRFGEARSGKLLSAPGDYRGYPSQYLWDSVGRNPMKLLTTGQDAKVELWDMKTNKLIFIFEHSPRASHVFFANYGKTIVTAAYKSAPKLWDAATGKLIATLIQPKALQELHNQPFPSMLNFLPQLSPDTRFVSLNSPGGAQLWDTSTGELRHTFKDAVYGSFTPDGKTFATAWRGKPDVKFDELHAELMLWDVATGQLKASAENLYRSAILFYWSTDAKTLLIVEFSRSKMRLIDLQRLELKSELPVGGCIPDAWFRAGCEQPAFSPSGRILMTQRNGDVKLWDVKTGQLIADLNEARNPAVFSPDGRFLCTASKDRNSLILWEIIDQ